MLLKNINNKMITLIVGDDDAIKSTQELKPSNGTTDSCFSSNIRARVDAD